MFCPISMSVIPEFTMIFGGPLPIIAILLMLTVSMSALAYGVFRARNAISRRPHSHDRKPDVEGVLSLCR